MLYLFAGDDTKNKLLAYENFLKTLPKKEEVFFIDKNNLDLNLLESFYSSASLFSPTSTVILRSVFEREEIKDLILERLSKMGASKSSFIFVEGKLNKPVVDLFKKARSEINIFEQPKEKTEKFNSFLLANAFGAKDKLNLWIYFRQAVDKGVMMEELAGILFWKVKDMLLKKDFRKFSEPELKNFSSRLSYLLPESRKEGKDAEAAFEQFLLETF